MSEAKQTHGELSTDFASYANSHGPGYFIWLNENGKRDIVGTTVGGSEKFGEIAARIVTAWNCHDELVAACEAYYYGRKEVRECEAMMGAALAKVERGGK